MSTVLSNKSQTSGHNGVSPIGLRPLFQAEVCDLFADTVLKPRPLLLHEKKYSWAITELEFTKTIGEFLFKPIFINKTDLI